MGTLKVNNIQSTTDGSVTFPQGANNSSNSNITGNLTVGGVIVADDSNNTTTAPPISFTGDTDTGIGRSADNTLDLITNGNSRFRIQPTGQIQAVYNSTIGSFSNENTTFGNGYLCRAWVNFNGTGNGTFTGGASTVSRTSGSTTATITTTNPHGLITGNTVNAQSGVVARIYEVTVTGANTFTITTPETGALNAVSITFLVNTIRASGNVSSITDNGTGDYTVNLTNAIPDTNYCIAGYTAYYNNSVSTSNVRCLGNCIKNTGSLRIQSVYISATNGSSANEDLPEINIGIFR